LDRYTTFYLADGKNLVSSETLKVYDDMLTSQGFFRPHNSHLVNISHIASFERRNGNFITMRDSSQVPVAVRKKEMLLDVLQKI
jgi:two-component system LytT family response regulator